MANRHYEAQSSAAFYYFPTCARAGAQRPDSIPEVGEDAASTMQPASGTALTEEEQAELHSELVKVSSLLHACLCSFVLIVFLLCTGLRRDN